MRLLWEHSTQPHQSWEQSLFVVRSWCPTGVSHISQHSNSCFSLTCCNWPPHGVILQPSNHHTEKDFIIQGLTRFNFISSSDILFKHFQLWLNVGQNLVVRIGDKLPTNLLASLGWQVSSSFRNASTPSPGPEFWMMNVQCPSLGQHGQNIVQLGR